MGMESDSLKKSVFHFGKNNVWMEVEFYIYILKCSLHSAQNNYLKILGLIHYGEIEHTMAHEM